MHGIQADYLSKLQLRLARHLLLSLRPRLVLCCCLLFLKFRMTIMKGKPLSASRDVLVLTLPLATTGTAGWLALDDSTGDSRVGDCALVGVGCSLALSGCGDAVADAVADADGPGRPGVLGASLSEEQTFNCRVG